MNRGPFMMLDISSLCLVVRLVIKLDVIVVTMLIVLLVFEIVGST